MAHGTGGPRKLHARTRGSTGVARGFEFRGTRARVMIMGIVCFKRSRAVLVSANGKFDCLVFSFLGGGSRWFKAAPGCQDVAPSIILRRRSGEHFED